MGRERLVIIGNGMAPGRMLEKLLEVAADLYEVTIFNAEPRVNYDRIMLSPVLSGEKSFADIVIHDDGFYERHGITLKKGCKAVAIDRELKTVTGADQSVLPYDKLVIATGSSPFIIPVAGNDLPGVVSYRDLDDVEAMLKAARSKRHAVVIGGGLLGLEAAAGLNRQGMRVSVVHLMPTLMERQLDAAAGDLLASALGERGIDILTGANTKAILGETEVTGVELADGRVLPADLVVMAVGIRPNAGLARDAGITVNRGIVVDATLQTSDPSIVALGECVEVEGQVFGLVAPLYDMADVLAARLAGDETARFRPVATATRLKVTGINLYSVGDFAGGADCEEIVLRDAGAGIYKRVVLKNEKIIGTVLYGETGDGPWYFDMLQQGADTRQLRDLLIFGQNFSGTAPLEPYGGRCSISG